MLLDENPKPNKKCWVSCFMEWWYEKNKISTIKTNLNASQGEDKNDFLISSAKAP